MLKPIKDRQPVSYTHLDVYKRQGLGCAGSFDYVEIAMKKQFADHRRILIDLLGAGYSDKPLDFVYEVKNHAKYLNEFLEDLNLDKIVLFGHSPVSYTHLDVYKRQVVELSSFLFGTS